MRPIGHRRCRSHCLGTLGMLALLSPALASVSAQQQPAAAATPPRPTPDEELLTFDPRPTLLQQLEGGEVWCVAFAADGKSLAVGDGGEGSRPGTLRLWDLPTHRERAAFPQSRPVRSLAYAQAGKVLAVGPSELPAKLVDASSGKDLLVLRGAMGGANPVAVTRDGSVLATASTDRTVRLWELPSGSALK